MKRCPQCRRDYYDDSLIYCLDDGSALLEGPGTGEESVTAKEGTNAIWSHKWYANSNLIGSAGPAFNRRGGVRIGLSDYWIGDYTIEPENGGLGIVAHEFGHDLGLPDLYDTSGNTGGAVNSTNGTATTTTATATSTNRTATSTTS